MQLMLPELDGRPEDTVFISGIGCAARFPYYMNTYGMHSIHGRAPAVATGLAISAQNLMCGSSVGMEICYRLEVTTSYTQRRNIDFTILLFNNQIYGLTKGQYSPTSGGKITKSTPMGSIDQPFNAVSIALGAEATFVARTHDMDRSTARNL